MTVRRPREARASRPSLFAPLVSLLLVGGLVTGCDSISGLFGDGEPPSVEETTNNYGPCWPAFGSDVVGLSSTHEGQVLYISDDEPRGWTGDSWDSDWRSLNVLDLSTKLTRYLATTWESDYSYASAATAEPGDEPPKGTPVVEQMQMVKVAEDTDIFVLGTTLDERVSGFANLYHGSIPPTGNVTMSPSDGLSRIPFNDPVSLQNVRRFEISPDGTSVIAVVGETGELRVYSIADDELTVYGRNEDGDVEVLHEAPPVGDKSWRPAYATPGVIQLAWSPDASTVALSRSEPRGITTLSLLDVASGDMVEVARFSNSTLPFAQFSEDGSELTVMRTDLVTSQFNTTRILRMPAEEDAEFTELATIPHPQGYRTEPALLTRVDDNTYLFTWEDGLWRVSVADAGSPAVRISAPDDQRVPYERPGIVTSLDQAVYRNLTPRNDGQVALRTHVFDDECPITEDQAEEESSAGG